MVSVREHIHRLNAHNAVHTAHKRKVACLGCRVATYIDNALGCCVQDNINYRLIDTCTRWIENNHIGTTILGDKVVIQHLLHIASVEYRILDAVNLRVNLCILDCLRHILDTHNLLSSLCAEVCDCTGTCVEVV